eukprot:CAMPEP_0202974750 /NCGR_PEP_ID=MMETSP1396-20130829/63632_1 /ASSEMBLY_ACC=CAM_ASM_000872 /TAXON_ID= /ORGANISM="Pseudokeronopsis sp., Strain Brazil" /LENGTH=133 /DNA_ID=CAMNT_0049709203 /DNA_START=23 /DNA_END=421 /DNA_ORIENTATION=+
MVDEGLESQPLSKDHFSSNPEYSDPTDIPFNRTHDYPISSENNAETEMAASVEESSDEDFKESENYEEFEFEEPELIDTDEELASCEPEADALEELKKEKFQFKPKLYIKFCKASEKKNKPIKKPKSKVKMAP